MIDLDKKCTIEKCCVCAHEERCRDNKTSLTFDLACPKEIKIRLKYSGHTYTPTEKALMLDIFKQYRLGEIVEKEKEKENMNSGREPKTYEQGLEEAWEIARKICLAPSVDNDYYTIPELIKMFNTSLISNICKEKSIHEIKAKIEAWEAEKAKLKLGDVVEIYGGSGEFYHTGIFIEEEEKNYIVLSNALHHTQGFSKINFRLEKTGKHFDIQGMLDEIKTED